MDDWGCEVTLKAPFPYFGGKSKVAPLIWERFGVVSNYVEPFFGSGAVLLARIACSNAGQPPEDHFVDIDKMVELGSGEADAVL